MKYVNLIRKVVWSFHRTTGLEWDDLFSEASLIYVHALKTYDPSKGIKFSTYLWRVLTNSLILYLDREKKAKTISIDDTDLVYCPANEPIPFWQELSTDAQQIANLILENSLEFVCLTTEDVELLINYIFEKKGWNTSRIQAAILDLKTACKV